MKKTANKKIVLAYSGGLDTSCIAKWLKDKYNAEVICLSGGSQRSENFKKTRQCGRLEKSLY